MNFLLLLTQYYMKRIPKSDVRCHLPSVLYTMSSAKEKEENTASRCLDY